MSTGEALVRILGILAIVLIFVMILSFVKGGDK